VNTQRENGFSLDAPTPNPADAQTLVTFELPATASVNMMIVDVAGRPVQQVMAGRLLPAGPQQVQIDTKQLPIGFYTILLEAEGTQLVQKFIVQR
jgi:hypothetical protein